MYVHTSLTKNVNRLTHYIKWSDIPYNLVLSIVCTYIYTPPRNRIIEI